MRKAFIVSLFLVIFFQFPVCVFAHPIDELGIAKTYDQKQTLEVSPKEIRLTIKLTFYSFDKVKVWESIDKNKDQNLSQEEKDTWMKKGQDASSVIINEKSYDRHATGLIFHESYVFLSNDPADVTIVSQCTGDTASVDTLDYKYKGKDKKLEEIDFTAKGIVGLSVSEVQKVSEDTVRIHITKGDAVDSGTTLGAKTSDRLNYFLNTYVKPESLTPELILIALVSAFFIGSLHALTPGHGKALVAGYLVGEKGTIKHAIQLGSIMTITHTSSVFLLGIIGLIFTQYALPLALIKNISFGSAVFILLLGFYLLITRFIQLRNHHHSHHDHPHPHELDQTVSFKTLLTLGVSGGIVPCIDALVILLIAITLHKVLYGIVLLISFSFGLAATLTCVGMICVLAKQKASGKLKVIGYIEPYSGIFSACVI